MSSLRPAIVGLGITSIVTQTVLLREFLSVFTGNELVIGIVLANWMILTGLGAILGRYVPAEWDGNRLLVVGFILLGLLPIVTVFLLDYLRNVLFPVGGMIGITESVYFSLLLLTPYCVMAGALFTLLASTPGTSHPPSTIAGVYALEAAGSVLGGILFNLFMIPLLSTFQVLCLLGAGAACVATYLAGGVASRVPFMGLSILVAVLLGAAILVDLDAYAKSFLFPNEELLLAKDAPYGSLAVTRRGGQINFYENTALLSSTNDIEGSEESVHYAMVQHPDVRNVLLVSGGLSGAIKEILKYGVDRVDYVELNPWLIDIGKRYAPIPSDARLHIIIADPRRFVRETTTKYDAALINAPDPETAQINRYFTNEFFQILKSKLDGDAVVSLSLTSSADYQGEDARVVNAIVANTLRESFRHVIVVPGLRNYYLASDGLLRLDVGAMIEARGIQTEYVNKYYIDDTLLRARSDAIMRGLKSQTPLNADFEPVAYYRQLLYWLSSLQFRLWIPGIVVGVMILLLMTRLNAVSFSMFAGGFAGSSLEVILLLSFQIIYGYVYQATGVIITAFMAGLALGSYVGHRRSPRGDIIWLIGVQAAIAASALTLPWLLNVLNKGVIGDSLVMGSFLAAILMVGFIVGMEFAVAARLLRGSKVAVASTLYGVDLIGSSVGALIVSAYMVPLLGIGKVCLLIAGVSALGSCVSIAARKEYSHV